MACFEKATRFKKLTHNILDSFGRENASRSRIISTTKSVKDENGNTISRYVPDPRRYLYLK